MTAQASLDDTVRNDAAFFRTNGYLIRRGVFAGAELVDLQTRARLIRARAEAELPAGMRFWYGRSCDRTAVPAEAVPDYSWGINEITRPDYCDPVLISALAHPNLDPWLNAILDRPRAWGLKLLWAPRRSHYDLGWHRDIDHELDAVVAYKPEANDHIQFNAALEADDSFIVVPRSHRRPLAPAEAAAMCESRTCELPGQLRVALEPGDVVIMDAHAIHRGEAQPGAPRLSLHYSCQAQWVPLKAWGEPEHFAWICSDGFIDALSPAAQDYYRRLRDAQRAPNPHEWMVAHARDHGWTGELVSPWPGGRRAG